MDPPSKPDVCKFVVNTSIRHQTIDNFSASDGWSMQFIGLWPDAKQNKMADWLFSTEMDASGKPKGIGLSLWRFNIGAGSSEQGDSSKIDRLAEARYLHGSSLLELKRYDEAAKSLGGVLEAQPKWRRADTVLNQLAWCYYHQEKFADAQRAFAEQRTKYADGPLAANAALMEAESDQS